MYQETGNIKKLTSLEAQRQVRETLSDKSSSATE